ncbi:hypothetical protein ACE1CD_14785 [Aerosakkonema sp. BLCC-F183]|uniref:hypothetical protein n=1 Tax=Aerosakkonema sp. BLCC-F183 TaxID=3342834 RepID=UPI0035B6E3AB
MARPSILKDTLLSITSSKIINRCRFFAFGISPSVKVMLLVASVKVMPERVIDAASAAEFIAIGVVMVIAVTIDLEMACFIDVKKVAFVK